ncbi:MAG: Jag N-terminal domain-containing protein [Ruminococcus sp.]|nr:Jag N-terminal domain-containing protein [Ruminococcus sp.]
MTKEVIKSASTIEEAKAAAMLELGLTEDDDFHYEVIKMPTKKILGLFGGSPAEVKVSVEVPDAPAKKEKAKKEQKPAPKAEKSAPKKENKPKAEKSAEAKTAEKPDFKPSDAHEETARYIVSVVKGLGLADCKIQAYEAEDEVLFELDCGEDYGIVIGRRGETLDAIQYLARMVENKGHQGYRRVSINVGNYREKREAALIALAKKDAARALRTGRSVHLEPMNPYERRIIHTAIQGIEGVTSYSTGVDLDRRVIIAPENAPRNTKGDKGDYRRNDRRDRRDRHDRPKREPYVPEIAADREKHSDAAGVSRYGKIEVKKDAEPTEE